MFSQLFYLKTRLEFFGLHNKLDTTGQRNDVPFKLKVKIAFENSNVFVGALIFFVLIARGCDFNGCIFIWEAELLKCPAESVFN